ncbi:MAG: hypothetical protein KDK63_03230 [Chlamydiia bacterium]|nr:hypothetical protein [Chlamydiia bacterium]
MEVVNPSIADELTTLQDHVMGIEGSSDQAWIESVTNEFSALRARIVQEEAFQHVDLLTTIYEALDKNKNSFGSIKYDLTAARANIEALPDTSDERIIQLSYAELRGLEVRMHREQNFEHVGELSELQQLLRSKLKPQTPPIAPTFGSINQYNNGTHPQGTFNSKYPVTCSSTTLSFVSEFLQEGSKDFGSERIDKTIRVGQELFLTVIAEREKELQAANIPEELLDLTRGNMLTPIDMQIAYEHRLGERPKAPDAFFMAKGEKDQETQLHTLLEKELLPLAQKSPNGKVGAAITINGKIFGIGLEISKEGKVNVTLFDSHGKKELHNGIEAGYVYQADSLEAGAKTLLRMLPIENATLDIDGLSPEEVTMIQEELEKKNEVALWIALPHS